MKFAKLPLITLVSQAIQLLRNVHAVLLSCLCTERTFCHNRPSLWKDQTEESGTVLLISHPKAHIPLAAEVLIWLIAL